MGDNLGNELDNRRLVGETKELRIGEKAVKVGDEVSVRRSTGEFESDWKLQISDEMQLGNKDIRPWIQRWKDNFQAMLTSGEVDGVHYNMIDNFQWQLVRYGIVSAKRDEELFRGYLMVEPESFPIALAILAYTARARKIQGKATEFKWLLKTEEPGFTKRVANGEEFVLKECGEYPYLAPEDPRIVLYGGKVDEIREVLTALSQHPQWQQIEDVRRVKFGGNPPRRPGTNSFLGNTRLEWKSLTWNDKPGFSETQSSDPNWRMKKLGTPTVGLV